MFKIKNLIFHTVITIAANCMLITASHTQCFTCASAPTGVFWCDDFENATPLSQKYFEYDDNSGDFIRVNGVGRGGGYGMQVIWQSSEVGAGNIKKSFGRTPDSYIGKYAVNPTQDYDEIYWRIDVRMQPGWTGNPAKLSRATCLANSNWAQGIMAHIWNGSGNFLAMDPASGIDVNGNLVSTTYNDFANLRWLGNKSGTIPIFQTSNSGNWYCVEAHAKLNTPGQSDGIFEFWINDTLQAGSYNLNWHGNYNSNPSNLKINVVMIENYWNSGSTVQQERYLDNFLISTQRIGCSCTTTGISETSEKNLNISVYPNPFSKTVTVDFSGIKKSYADNLSFHLYDLPGKEIAVFDKISTNKLILEKNNLVEGIYLYKVLLNEEYICSGKLIVQ